jgi:hypothetical protein
MALSESNEVFLEPDLAFVERMNGVEGFADHLFTLADRMGTEEFDCVGASLEEDLIEPFSDLCFVAREHLEATQKGGGIDRLESWSCFGRSGRRGLAGWFIPR